VSRAVAAAADFKSVPPRRQYADAAGTCFQQRGHLTVVVEIVIAIQHPTQAETRAARRRAEVRFVRPDEPAARPRPSHPMSIA
jgi:hypothetical protein